MIITTLLSLMIVVGNATPEETGTPRPNIILIMPDDIGYGDFGCHGNPFIRTPNIDKLYRESARFTDFHVSPTCAPTRAALLTGRHEFKSGVTHTIAERERLSLKATTLPQLLKNGGYTTGLFGKWHLGDEPEYQPERRGFDEVYIHGGGGIGQTFAGSCGDAPDNSYFDPAILHNGTFEKTRGYCTNLFFSEAICWMNAQVTSHDKPFFAMITPNAAHEPLECPTEYSDRYLDNLPENVAKFFGMIENIDDNVGFLMEKLEHWKIAENTLVIFLTDNGGTNGTKVYNAGMRGSKNTPYQGGTRVPSFWRWPSTFQGGRDIGALTAHIDVLPTLADFLDLKLSQLVKDQVEGRSLKPLLKNPHEPWPNRTLVTHLGRWDRGQAERAKYQKHAIRDERYTLVNDIELYDLKIDPGESTNVITDRPDVAARLRQDYDRWWQSVLPKLENENAIGPKVNPFKARYWAQFGGGPDAALRKRMDPSSGDQE